ncbi:MAG TPA: NAD(P)/FAD-dependent oxidoreductase [Candidatus Dormibacteraeota bacterium]|nr:NAD(P)/FAD-dependent oxidoreductase [Candidatus Dormibacteraeota bacterium]
MRKIAIVGGGPSGAVCGERLARAGFDVTLFDEHLAWEKPCGGGLTHKAIQAYPFLLDGPHPKKLIYTIELISSGGHRALLPMEQPIVVYSRAVLNGLLLDRASAAGCRVLRSRVTQVDTKIDTRPDKQANIKGHRVRLQIASGERGGEHFADFVVIASGARNTLLPDTHPLKPEDLEMTLGYFVPAQAAGIKVKFLRRFEGYLWSFPRCDHLSVGICGSMARHTSQELRNHLNEFMRQESLSPDGARFYSHVLPSPQPQTLSARRVVGENWALVGDAAAWVDPITGEGLYYALRSGDLLGQALAEGRPEEYPARVRADFSADLEFATRVARRFYRGRFLGGAVATRMIQFVQRSATFRELMGDVFSGTQDYRSLKRRLWAQFGVTIGEVASSLLKLAPALRDTPPRGMQTS